MAENKPIIINNFQKGIAPSAYLGFEEIRGLDITTRPGCVRPNYSTENEDDGAVTGLITQIIRHGSDNYGHDGTNLYKMTPDTTIAVKTGSSTGTKNGLFSYKSYIILGVNAKLDGYDGTTFDQGFVTTLSSSSGDHPMCWASDDALYIGSGRYVDKLIEVAGQNFDPASGATFTFSANALDLPEGEVIRRIVEMGGNLYLICQNKIYPWDMISSSFEIPITFNDLQIFECVVYNNLMYVQAGYDGKWYVSNGTSLRLFAKIPDSILNLRGSTTSVSCATIGNGLIYFGLNMTGGGNGGRGGGIWSLNPDNGALNYEALITTGQDGSVANYPVSIGAIYYLGITTSGFLYSFHDQNGASADIYGVDTTTGLAYSGDQAYLISQFFRVGTKINKRTFQSFHIQLTKPLASPDSVKAYYRTAINGSWTQIGATFSAVGEQSYECGFAATCESIQFKIILNRNAELLEVMAY